jgi:hypothetical protein
MSKIDIEVAGLASDITTTELEISKVLFWIDKLKFMKTERNIVKNLHEETINHLKKRGVISSFNEYGKIKEGLRRTNLELISIENDLRTVETALKRLKGKLSGIKDQYDRTLKIASRRGVILQFRSKK